MRNGILTLALLLLFINSFSQNFQYRDHDGRTVPVKKEKLKDAKLISDVIPNYQAGQYNKFFNYASVEISATCNGKALAAKGTSEQLTPEQKNILRTADMNSDIVIKINSTYKNAENGDNNLKVKEVVYVVMPGPEVEAQYPGGMIKMYSFLDEQVTRKISANSILLQIPKVEVSFVVNEKGEITDAKISGTSDDAAIDKLVLEAFYKMPNWKPATNAQGDSIQQKIIIVVGGGC